jgi:hypothetical protein
MHKFVQLTLLGVFAAAGATLAVCLATTVDGLSVANRFQPWPEAGRGVGDDPVLPSAAPRPARSTPARNVPVPGKIADHQPPEEAPRPLWPADAVDIESQPPTGEPPRRYEHLIVAAGRWLGQQHQAMHVMGRGQIGRVATGLAHMMPPAGQADSQLATEASAPSDDFSQPPDPDTGIGGDSRSLQPSEPLLTEFPAFTGPQPPELGWATDARKVRVRPRPATAATFSRTDDGIDKYVDRVLTKFPPLPAKANPADRRAAAGRTDTRHR